MTRHRGIEALLPCRRLRLPSSPGLTGRSSIHHHRRNEHGPIYWVYILALISRRIGYWVARSSRATTPVGSARHDDTVGSRDQIKRRSTTLPLSSPGLTGRSSIHHHRRNTHWSHLLGLHPCARYRAASVTGSPGQAGRRQRWVRATTPVGFERRYRWGSTIQMGFNNAPLVVARLDRAIQYSPSSPE